MPESAGVPGPKEEVLERLAAALADRYALKYEIGHGGMGRIFLARDLRHDREVAVKVLHPELCDSVGTQRFLHEIRTAAHLLHPHILPLHDSGQANGLLYYVMPFAGRETLRDRLEAGPLSIEQALRIITEVADALSCAHEQGVVHRDVKPENILLPQGQHALLMDFGLARALSAASLRRITPTGFVIGSPLYMSPEQAEGKPEVGPAADVYSLGCILFEMLAGEPPFAARTPVRVLQRKLTEAPPSVRVLRHEVSPALERVVATAMARDPADRFPDAAAFQQAVQRAVAQPARRVVRSVAAPVLLAAAVGIVVAALLLWRSTRPAAAPLAREEILVADFGSATGDTALAAVLAELVRVDLSQSARVMPLPDARIGAALERMERSASERLSSGVAREIALREGAPAVVTGEVNQAGGRYLIQARVLDADSGRVLAALHVAADSAGLLSAIERLSHGIRERSGESLRSIRHSPPLEGVTTGSLTALRKYSRAARLIDREGDYPTGITLLQQAVALDPRFAMAYRKLGTTLENLHLDDRATTMYRLAYLYRAHLPERERYLAEAEYRGIRGQREDQINAYRMLLASYPGDRVALNNLGIVYLQSGEPGRAAAYFAQAVGADSSMALARENLAEALFNAGRTAEAVGVLREFRRRFPENPRGMRLAGFIAAAHGDYGAAQRAFTEVLERGGENAAVRTDALEALADIATLHGRPAEAERYRAAAMRLHEERGEADAWLREAAASADALTWLRHDRPGAVSLLDRALSRHPLDGISFLRRPYHALVQAYADAGAPARAELLLREMLAGPDSLMADRMRRERQLARAAVRLAEGKPDAALEQLKLLPAAECAPCGLQLLGRAEEARGAWTAAIDAYQRFLARPYAYRLREDAVWLPFAYRRLEALYARVGDPQRAGWARQRLRMLQREAEPAGRDRRTEYIPSEAPRPNPR